MKIVILGVGEIGGVLRLASVCFRFLLLMASIKDLVACSGSYL